MPIFSTSPLPFRLSNQNSVCISHRSMRATCPAHLVKVVSVTG
jgi:hypothetical protein